MLARQDITGLLLAGGQGARMGGQDKGLLLLQGRPLAAHVLERLRPQVGPVAISANRHAAEYAGLGCPVWPDAPPAPHAAAAPAGPPVSSSGPANTRYRGPLAGMLAGLTRCTTEWLAAVPCDSPNLPVDLVARLADALRGHGGLLASACSPGAHGEGPRSQPVFCLMHRSLQAGLAEHLARGQHRVRQWQAEMGGIEVMFDDARAFANVNTPEELARWQAG